MDHSAIRANQHDFGNRHAAGSSRNLLHAQQAPQNQFLGHRPPGRRLPVDRLRRAARRSDGLRRQHAGTLALFFFRPVENMILPPRLVVRESCGGGATIDFV